MLKRGSVLCRAIGKADQYHSMADVELPEGTHFGERAFTHREPRACDVTRYFGVPLCAAT